MEEAALTDVFNCCGISFLFFPIPTSSAIETPENTDVYLDDPEPAEEGDIQIEYSFD
jgi:hypothetical protein